LLFLFLFIIPVEISLKSISNYGTLDLISADYSDKAVTILNSWGNKGKNKLLIKTIFNFLFIISYVVFLTSVLILSFRKLPEKFKVKSLFRMTFLPLFAGIFDFITNVFLIFILVGFVKVGNVFFIIFWTAGIAFVCVYFSICTILFDWLVILLMKTKNKLTQRIKIWKRNRFIES
jgi:hypothetical protein